MYVCVYTHTQCIQNIHIRLPVRGLPSPFLLLPGVRGKIPGTQPLLLCSTSMKGRRGLDGVGAEPGSRMPGSPVPTSRSLGLCLSPLLYQLRHPQSLDSRRDSRQEKLKGSPYTPTFGQGLLYHPPRPAGTVGRIRA